MSKPTTILQTIGEILKDTYFYYRGRVISKENSHCFTVGRNTYTSLDDAKAGIDESYKSLSNSIRR